VGKKKKKEKRKEKKKKKKGRRKKERGPSHLSDRPLPGPFVPRRTSFCGGVSLGEKRKKRRKKKKKRKGKRRRRSVSLRPLPPFDLNVVNSQD